MLFDIVGAGPYEAGQSYTSQPDLRPHSYLRRCCVSDNGTSTTIEYYLDADSGLKIAGTWNNVTKTQTGWLRIYEGQPKCGNGGDPVKHNGTGNQYIRRNLLNWNPATSYSVGDRVLYNNTVWESLSNANVNITPEPGTYTANLTGATYAASQGGNAPAGDIMVEIREFYFRHDFWSGSAWTNIKGENVSGDYTGTLSPETHIWQCITPEVYNTLPSGDQAKYIRHWSFWKDTDSSANRTFSIEADTVSVLGTPTQVTIDGNPHVLNGPDGVRRRYFSAYRPALVSSQLVSRSGATLNVNATLPAGRTAARLNRSNGWGLADYALWTGLQSLYLTEYRNFFSQNSEVGIGTGRTSPSTFDNYSAGLSNFDGNSSNGPDITYMTYRGIEHFYNGTWRWIDGINFEQAVSPNFRQPVWVRLNPAQFASDTSTGHTLIGYVDGNFDSRIANSSYGTFVKDFRTQIGFGFLPRTGLQTSNTYVTDANWAAASSGWRVLAVGGSAGNGALSGVWAAYSDASSSGASASFGPSLAR